MISITDPGPVASNPQSTRQRQTIFLKTDDAAYSKTLVRAFPGVRFWDCVPFDILKNRERPPDVKPLRSLAECRDWLVDIVFDPDWRPRWVWDEYFNEWRKGSVSIPSGVVERSMDPYHRGNERWAWDERSEDWKRRPASSPVRPGEERWILSSGRIYYRFLTGNKAQEAAARKAIRLIDKVASNRDLMAVDAVTLEVLHPTCIGAPSVGHHARRWCLEDPTRLLKFSGVRGRYAYRPKPE